MGFVPTSTSTPIPNASNSSSNSPALLHLNGDSDSALHVISDTPYGGRGAFATTNIPKGTLVLTSSAPYASVVLRKFRKEVCSWCFGYSFEKGKRKWDVRLGGEGGADSRGTNNSNGKNNTTTMATTIFFCSVECRERWVGDYRGPTVTRTTTLVESGSGDGIDLWFQLYSLLERTYVQETATALSKSRSKSNSKSKSKAKAKPTPTNRNHNHTNSTLSTASETLIHRLESLTADQVSNDVVNSLWSLADVVFADEKGVLAVLRQWALGGGQSSSSSPSDTSSSSSSHGSEGGGGDGGNAGGNAGGHDGVFLTEFELDCARFVLDGLFRRALQEYRQSSVSSSSSTTTTTQPDWNGNNTTDPDVINDGKTRKTGLGLWTDLLKLQDNEVNNVRCRPSILASFIRVFGFLKHVVFMTFKNSRQGQRSPAASKTNGKCVDINGVGAKVDGVVEAGENNTSNGSAVVNDDSEKPSSEFSVSSPILDILRKYLWQSGAVRAITARDHSNVFGIWEQAEEEEDSDADCEMLGWGMYISGAYFNHDCSPNLKKRRSGRSMQFFTIRDVQAGEELCTNYIDIGEECSVEMRNEELEREWFFRCACGRCVRERGEREEGNKN